MANQRRLCLFVLVCSAIIISNIEQTDSLIFIISNTAARAASPMMMMNPMGAAIGAAVAGAALIGGVAFKKGYKLGTRTYYGEGTHKIIPAVVPETSIYRDPVKQVTYVPKVTTNNVAIPVYIPRKEVRPVPKPSYDHTVHRPDIEDIKDLLYSPHKIGPSLRHKTEPLGGFSFGHHNEPKNIYGLPDETYGSSRNARVTNHIYNFYDESLKDQFYNRSGMEESFLIKKLMSYS